MTKLVALLTDFGLTDPYVAQVKGKLLSLAPDCRIVDVCHELEPYAPVHGSFYLWACGPHFPKGTLFVAVIDPGVGSGRRLIYLEKEDHGYLAPDNGLLEMILGDDTSGRAFDVSEAANVPGVSATFHGRDVFAPLAARLATGESPESMGFEIPLDTLVRLPDRGPRMKGENLLTAHALHVDRFGNIILDIPNEPWMEQIRTWPLAAVARPRHCTVTVVRTYSEIPESGVGILEGSHGLLELALDRGSAAKRLHVATGDTVDISFIRNPTSI